ncbi:ADP,ATP carrier protein ER-ANT1 [Lingula anatina]|uniref:ADP,ATP carrier protein ER-ANT1 n=1 Tax=Lingula anatina TaxID=7574 RepID=A0A1S3JXT1_LINAN|nr:ADP,ATP carrier protein ER-ANT1 [Lingula anatina]|eukprot:XP_013415220.1 ADP,ATP carrier protein ER-ANT1 [Lingula anatina]
MTSSFYASQKSDICVGFQAAPKMDDLYEPSIFRGIKVEEKYENFTGHPIGSLVIAGGAGGFSGVLAGPTSVMAMRKAFIQTQGYNPPSMYSMWPYIRNVTDFKRRALLPLFEGSFTNMLRFGTNLGATFVTSEMLKRIRPNRDTNVFVHVICGAIAGAVGQAAAHPYDVARLRLMLDGKAVVKGEIELTPHQRYNGGLVNAIKMDGYHTLSRGIVLSVAGAALYRGIQLGLYDTVFEETKLAKYMSTNQDGIFFQHPFMSRFVVAWVTTFVAQVATYEIDTQRKQQMYSGKSLSKASIGMSQFLSFLKTSPLAVLRTSLAGAIPLALVSDLLYHYHHGIPLFYPLFSQYRALRDDYYRIDTFRYDMENPEAPCYLGK